ncbi:hypothetical protein [Rhizobium brockwellii]|uniref:hypothetical protein n=1 Tax=Rhizobium brockwellii TaxID=3019932 RepID=UPI00293DEFF8|nr:hypothetical protein [Rhizobium brockwellii]MDV4159315.1 hypothetical protein [Rhizobium brockwellii]
MLKIITTAFLLSLSTAAFAKQPEVLNIAHTIWIHESGSFLAKTFHEMDTPEFTKAMDQFCSNSEVQCQGAVPVLAEAIHITQPSTGGDWYTTGVIHKQAGEEWHIAFPAPKGYVACNAKKIGVGTNKGDSSDASIYRNRKTGENWLGSYAEVPKHRKEGHWVDAKFIVQYVEDGTETKYHCVPNGTLIWKQ